MSIAIKTSKMSNFTSLHIGGEVFMVTVANQKELVEAVMYAKSKGFRVHILGSGTNTFFSDPLQDLLVIKNEIQGISFEQQEEGVCMLTVGAGENWDEIVAFSIEKKLWGIENLSGIPGTVGAAPVQNIGAYGVELKDVFFKLSAIDMKTLDLVEFSLEACDFGYRDSFFKQHKGRYCIVSVALKLSVKANPRLTYKPLDTLSEKKDITPEEVRALVVRTRQAKLPDWKKYPNAGSFFKNPVVSFAQAEYLRERYPNIPYHEVKEGYKIPAAWLIEHIAEVKGLKIGDIGTWPNQPLVLVNYGTASAQEILGFSNEIIRKIKDATAIVLEREVDFVE